MSESGTKVVKGVSRKPTSDRVTSSTRAGFSKTPKPACTHAKPTALPPWMVSLIIQLVSEILKKILEQMRSTVSKAALRRGAQSTGGDAKDALNDLEEAFRHASDSLTH